MAVNPVCVGPGRKPECWFSHYAAHINCLLMLKCQQFNLTSISKSRIDGYYAMGFQVARLQKAPRDHTVNFNIVSFNLHSDIWDLV